MGDATESASPKSTQPLSDKRMEEIRANLAWTIEECGMYSPPYAEMYIHDVGSLLSEIERLRAQVAELEQQLEETGQHE